MIRVGEPPLQVNMGRGFDTAKKMKDAERTDAKSQTDNGFHSFDFDIEYANYVREVIPRTVSKGGDYFQELCNKSASYLNTVRESRGDCEFDDFVTGDAYAYSEMYNSIVDGHRKGTRLLYVYDPEVGEHRPLTLEEELEKLDRGYDGLMAWNAANARIASSQVYVVERQKRQPEKQEESYGVYSANEVCDYIKDIYTRFRSNYLQEYKRGGGNVDIKAVLYPLLQGRPGIHDYCKRIFRTE
ncbi:MAG: hypothetical protein K1W26_17610 [Acetatifactor sp.]